MTKNCVSFHSLAVRVFYCMYLFSVHIPQCVCVTVFICIIMIMFASELLQHTDHHNSELL